MGSNSESLSEIVWILGWGRSRFLWDMGADTSHVVFTVPSFSVGH